ncbi:MAG: DUF3618 domain-containing protein [Propionicimonas sp.]
MNTDPSRLRDEIEQTRSRLSDNVDALADQANPARMAKRQVSKAKAATGRFLDRILGTAEDVRDAAVDTAQQAVEGVQEAAEGVATRARDVVETVADAPAAARQQAQGNPLAAGVVAFGVGLLLAAAFPPSRKERELAQTVKEQAKPLTDQIVAAGQEVVGKLAEPAQEAFDSLKESAADAVQHVQEEGSAAVSDVQDVMRESAGDVAETTQQSVREVQREADTGSDTHRY